MSRRKNKKKADKSLRKQESGQQEKFNGQADSQSSPAGGKKVAISKPEPLSLEAVNTAQPVVSASDMAKKPLEETQSAPTSAHSKTSGPIPQNLPPHRSAPGLATTIAGMFLTFVLGLYLGTLYPGVKETLIADERGGAPMPANPATMPQPTPQMDAAPPLPPKISARLDELNKLIAENPAKAEYWTEQGNLYFDANQVRQAIHAYEHSLELEPRNPDVLTDKGIMHREAGEYEKAVECFRKASAIDPGHANALFNEGVVLAMDLHRNTEAAQAWRKLLQIRPDMRAPDGKPISQMIDNLR